MPVVKHVGSSCDLPTESRAPSETYASRRREQEHPCSAMMRVDAVAT